MESLKKSTSFFNYYRCLTHRRGQDFRLQYGAAQDSETSNRLCEPSTPAERGLNQNHGSPIITALAQHSDASAVILTTQVALLLKSYRTIIPHYMWNDYGQIRPNCTRNRRWRLLFKFRMIDTEKNKKTFSEVETFRVLVNSQTAAQFMISSNEIHLQQTGVGHLAATH